MSHLGEGSWGQFRRAVDELTASLPNEIPARRFRVELDELAHANFFIEDSQRWRVRLPSLVGLVGAENLAVLCGARTPDLVNQCESAALARNCTMEKLSTSGFCESFRVEGEPGSLRAMADDLQISYVSNFVNSLASTIVPLSRRLDEQRSQRVPANWPAFSFDLYRLEWVPGLIPRAPCEFRSMNGQRLYGVAGRRRGWHPMGKRESVFVAAAMKGIRLIQYDSERRYLSVPWTCALPGQLPRVASLCSGRPSVIDQGLIRYEDIPVRIAEIIKVAVGEPHPGFEPA